MDVGRGDMKLRRAREEDPEGRGPAAVVTSGGVG